MGLPWMILCRKLKQKKSCVLQKYMKVEVKDKVGNAMANHHKTTIAPT